MSAEFPIRLHGGDECRRSKMNVRSTPLLPNVLYSYQIAKLLIMYQAYKFRIYPTQEQKDLLARSFGCCRWFWNYALNLCQQTYLETGFGLTRNKIQSLLPPLKKEYPWLKSDVYSQCLQVVALNLSVLSILLC